MFPARAANNGNRHAGTQAGFQLALLASTLAISIFGGLLTGKDALLSRMGWESAYNVTYDACAVKLGSSTDNLA